MPPIRYLSHDPIVGTMMRKLIYRLRLLSVVADRYFVSAVAFVETYQSLKGQEAGSSETKTGQSPPSFAIRSSNTA